MAFERLLNSVHETDIVFENLSNINGDMLQKAWGLNIGEDSMQYNHGELKFRTLLFCIIACFISVNISKNICSLESISNLLQNLSNRDFLAQFVQKLCACEHSF